MASHEYEKESFGYVLRKHRVLLSALSLLIILAIAFSLFLNYRKRSNRYLHLETPPPPPGLKPVEFLVDTPGGNLGTILTETTPVGEEYFQDTLFVGDSLTEGIRIYESFQNVNTVALLGINTQSALTHTFHDVGDGKLLTMIEAIEYYRPRKLYMMLGTNGLNWQTPEWNLEHYGILIDEIISRVPGCYIVIQSLPPTLPDVKNFPKETIDTYNAGLRELALQKGVYFLDVHAALVGEDGYLIPEIAAGDGIHMNNGGYSRWHDYILNHAIQGESAFSVAPDGSIVYIQITPGTTDEPAEESAGTGEGDGTDGSGEQPPDPAAPEGTVPEG